MADRWGVSKNVLTPSLRKNAKNKKKNPTKGKQIALSLPFKLDREVQNNMKFSRSNTQQLVR